ncbi:MAG TPA: hypothetical protein VHF45_08735 [Thermoleophilaceae bacterium]|nr:hypothetical protein [Thermoleophilaceae bacterium]
MRTPDADGYLLLIAALDDDNGAARELYGLPLAEFTRARDELARRLRKDGRREEADAVKGLRKPTIAAWALNQLARRREPDVARLLGAGERLRQAQAELLAGGGREELDAAAAEERELVAALARDAAAIAADAGTGSSETLLEKLRATLHAVAADEELARQLAAGRVLRESEAVGVLGITPAAGAPPAPRRQPPKERGRPAREVREIERRLKAARGEERDARRRKETTARALARASERAARAADQLAAAQREEDEAAAALEEAEARTRELEGRLEGLREGD